MRRAAASRMKARLEAMTPEEREALHAKQAAGRAGTKASRVKKESKGPTNTERIASRARELSCTGPCPFIAEVVSRVATALLAELPTGQDHEAQRVALLAVKLARTPSRDPRWYDALGLLHKAAAEYAEHHPAIKGQVDRAGAEG